MRAVEISLHRARLSLVHEIASPSHPYFFAENAGTTWSIASDYLVPAILVASWETPEEIGALSRAVTEAFPRTRVRVDASAVYGRAT